MQIIRSRVVCFFVWNKNKAGNPIDCLLIFFEYAPLLPRPRDLLEQIAPDVVEHHSRHGELDARAHNEREK